MAALRACNFTEIETRERFDCFRGTSKERVARKLGVAGINVSAQKVGA